MGFELAADDCSALMLGTVRVSPESVAVGASSVLTFTATAFSTCGTNLTNVTHFSWRLSSSSVGSLGPDEGASVVYAACIAPMDGVLHLQGVYNGTTLTANATIKIAGGGDAPPGAPAAPAGSGGQDLWSGKAVGIALMGILIVGGVAVFLWGQRQDRPKRPG